MIHLYFVHIPGVWLDLGLDVMGDEGKRNSVRVKWWKALGATLENVAFLLEVIGGSKSFWGVNDCDLSHDV